MRTTKNQKIVDAKDSKNAKKKKKRRKKENKINQWIQMTLKQKTFTQRSTYYFVKENDTIHPKIFIYLNEVNCNVRFYGSETNP